MWHWLTTFDRLSTMPGPYVLMLFEWWNKENKAELEQLPSNLQGSMCGGGGYRRVNHNRAIINKYIQSMTFIFISYDSTKSPCDF